MAVMAEWQTQAAKWGKIHSEMCCVCVCLCVCVFVTDVAKLPRHPELPNVVSPVAKHYLHVRATMDVLENVIPGSSDFTTCHLTNSPADKLAVAKARRPSKAMPVSQMYWVNASNLETFVRMNPCRNINIKRFSGHVSDFTASSRGQLGMSCSGC